MALIPAGLLSIKRLLAIGAMVVLLAIGSLAILIWAPAQAGPPRSGLTRTQAIEAAWPHADAGAIGVVSSEVRKDFNTGFDLPIHHWAWVVTFYGHWQLLCDGACDRTTEWVAIDYSTGVWIASQYSYQAHPSG
jgi:hypothetical protein